MNVKLQDIASQTPTGNPNPEGNIPEGQPADQTQQQSSQQPNTDDLFKRVTQFVENENPANKSEDEIDNDIYNDAEFRKKIDAIEDPQLKEYLTKLRKSGVRGVNEKLSEIAEIRKELQAVKSGLQKEGWSPQRIQQLMNDPEFLKAAQQVVGSQNVSDDDEYIPDSVKQKLAELDDIKKQMQNWQQAIAQQNFEQQHNQLSRKYGNYDRNKIDEIRKELLEGKIQATNEHLYKAFYHDENLKRAYELGKKDAMSGIDEKQQANSFEGVTQFKNKEVKPEDNETSKQFWNRIVKSKIEALNKK